MWPDLAAPDLEAFATDHTDETQTVLWIFWLVTVLLTILLVARQARIERSGGRRRWIAGGVLAVLMVTALALGVPWYLDSTNVEPYATVD